MFFKLRRETTIFDQFCFREGLKQSLKVLTGLHDSCSSQIDWSQNLYSLALTRMSFRDFPLRYEMRGGSLKMFLRYGWFCMRCHFPMSMFLRWASWVVLSFKGQYFLACIFVSLFQCILSVCEVYPFTRYKRTSYQAPASRGFQSIYETNATTIYFSRGRKRTSSFPR